MSKILIVEDDPTLANMYEDEFKFMKFDVLLAKDGTEGLKIALDEHPDVILLDILMPKMDGIQMMKELRGDTWGAKVPIVILTNLDANDEIIKVVLVHQPAYYLLKANNTPTDVVNKVQEIIAPKTTSPVIK